MKSFLKLFFLLLFSLSFAVPRLGAEENNPRPKKGWREYFSRGSEESSGRRKKAPRESEETNPEGMVDLIDSPTTNVVDYGGFRLNFRLYKQGSLLSHLSFGVFRRLNLGASWDVEKFIGVDDPSTNPPTLNVKFRVYDGGEALPSFSFGYDGQGRFFDKSKDEYVEKERGLYGVLGRELFAPHLVATGGINIADFKRGTVLGFVGASYTMEEKFVLLLEFDNLRSAPGNRLNAGMRVFPIPALGIDFAVRDLTDSGNRERIVRINYVGSF
ncbi:MAG: hypothetical protein HYY07_02975 [Elusimicrobia bacterium]|nr:hypothetical protein [Elusimicrobiota bacterium]